MSESWRGSRDRVFVWRLSALNPAVCPVTAVLDDLGQILHAV
ncbi:hypothetical protein [Hoyosella subflava]|uniref:Uncharacterized protein n=1 Tax=Hoyosella subflava (strain DSM 45089 / JCM 17490 / NBRC 109087 / DQS3-9A1) TaxID=443218 RepID=F6EL63_HOYSD|nr:hypothetical protein [Hoyosella subflava]AEF42726.1 hypothetical protein AS9A_4293 [Hoyosella subflava DQS3-9A1]